MRLFLAGGNRLTLLLFVCERFAGGFSWILEIGMSLFEVLKCFNMWCVCFRKNNKGGLMHVFQLYEAYCVIGERIAYVIFWIFDIGRSLIEALKCFNGSLS